MITCAMLLDAVNKTEELLMQAQWDLTKAEKSGDELSINNARAAYGYVRAVADATLNEYLNAVRDSRVPLD